MLMFGSASAFATAPAIAARPVASTPVAGRIVLYPGLVQIHTGSATSTIGAPDRLDFGQLVDLVTAQPGGAQLLQRTRTTVVVQVPIMQEPGSRLAISSGTVPSVQFTGRGRLSGNGAVLSVNGSALLGRGSTPGKTGDLNPLIGYQGGSGVRMSRVQVDDQRTGKGAGPAVDVIGGQLRITSAQVSGGLGSAIHLDDVPVAQLTGVQVQKARGAGLIAGGATNLGLTDVTLIGNAGPGLTLSGRALTLDLSGAVRLVGNDGGTAGQLAQRGTGAGLNLSAIQIVAKKVAPHAVSAVTHPPARTGRAGLPLSWLVVTAWLLVAGAIGIEVARNRIDRHRAQGRDRHQIRTRWAGSR